MIQINPLYSCKSEANCMNVRWIVSCKDNPGIYPGGWNSFPRKMLYCKGLANVLIVLRGFSSQDTILP